MIGLLFRWLTGGGIAAIGEQINRAYAAKLNAQNNSEKIEAEQQIVALEARQSVLLAEQSSWHTSWIRPCFALPFVLFIWKLVIWDKMLGLGTTPDLSPDLWKLMWIIVGAYFLTRPFEKMRR